MSKLLEKAQWLVLPALTLVIACAAMIFKVESAYAQDASVIDVDCTVTKDSNVRSGPGTNFKVINTLKAGDQVLVDDTNSDKSWLHHELGWTASYLLDCDGEALAENANATETMTNTTSLEGTGDWAIKWFTGATEQMRGHGDNPWAAFPALTPSIWTEFPDVANELAQFPAQWGLMYEEDETQHCGASDDQCSIVVAPGHYMLITGSWDLEGLGSCHGSSLNSGCALAIVNVGDVAAEFKGTLDNVFIVSGRFHHGDHLPEATSGLMSHATWNMTHGESKLNPKNSVNAGGNCSVKKGCKGVNNQFFITSGAEVLIHGETNWGAVTSEQPKLDALKGKQA